MDLNYYKQSIAAFWTATTLTIDAFQLRFRLALEMGAGGLSRSASSGQLASK